jgi:hypothetical protein
MDARHFALVSMVISALGCDPPPTPRTAPTPDARPPARLPDPPPSPDRVATRTVLSFFHWTRTDPPAPGEDQGVDHGRVDLSLVVEVHKNPRNEAWITVGALAPNVDIPEHRTLRAEGSTATWHLPREGFNDARKEPFGGEIRGDEPVRVYLAAQPDHVVELRPANEPTAVRLPAEGTFAANARASAGQVDAFVVAVIPMRNRRGGRYLLQVLDMNAQPGGFGQNGVMDHLPTRAEVDRYTAWMRDPRGMGAERRPPIAALPIDRS